MNRHITPTGNVVIDLWKITTFFMCACLLLLGGASCNQTNNTENAFYYWKTSFEPIPQHTAGKSRTDHFYIHYFDVSWDKHRNMPVPVANLSVSPAAKPFLQNGFTPVVYITNSCFQETDLMYCDTLAQKVYDRIETVTQQLQDAASTTYHPTEIQIDCDWTPATKDKYFRFLHSIRQLYPRKQLSVTIRLYPYKYRTKMGIPPADKGVLMCYNLGKINATTTGNSVFDINELKQYLIEKPYPIPLDVALPIFGWYAWFRGDKFKDIIYDNPGGLSGIGHSTNGSHLIVSADTVTGERYLRRGDILRMEYPDADALENAAHLLTSKLKPKRIIFFYWDNDLVSRYESTVEDIFSSY